MSHESLEFLDCAVCGRSILKGERVAEYVTTERETALVCSLCKGAAERAGWIPAELAGSLPEAPAPRGGTAVLRERLERAGERAAERVRSLREAAERARRERQAPPPRPQPPPRLDEGPRTPERLIRMALEYFNATEEPRKVAGLSRSLGEPMVAAHPDAERATVEVTVAWELSWYRWEVRPDGEVRQLAHGDEIEELEPDEDMWNALASEDGRLRLDSA